MRIYLTRVLQIELWCTVNITFFLYTLFQFGLTIARIQNTVLINAKRNNALSGKYYNTLIRFIVQ